MGGGVPNFEGCPTYYYADFIHPSWTCFHLKIGPELKKLRIQKLSPPVAFTEKFHKEVFWRAPFSPSYCNALTSKNLAKEIQNSGAQEIQKNLQEKSKEVLQKKSWFLVCGGRTSSPYPITVGWPPPPYSHGHLLANMNILFDISKDQQYEYIVQQEYIVQDQQYGYIVQHIKRSTSVHNRKCTETTKP